jgi:hypothetical protein
MRWSPLTRRLLHPHDVTPAKLAEIKLAESRLDDRCTFQVKAYLDDPEIVHNCHVFGAPFTRAFWDALHPRFAQARRLRLSGIQRWSRLSEQNFRFDKWSLCRG